MPRRLAVVAGTGALPLRAIEAALAGGDEVRAFVLSSEALPMSVQQQPASASEPAALFDAIRAFGASHVTLAGAVTLSDTDRQKLLLALGAGERPTGDAALSHLVIRLQEITGALLVGPHQLAPDLLSPEGRIAGPEPSPQQLASGRRALAAAREVGRMDLGQAAVVFGTRVVAVEDVAGTDDLLARVARYRADGLIGDTSNLSGVLAKACKPQQPLFVDLPAIGRDTIVGARTAGISLIALEAARTLLLEREALVAAADQHGISVVGLAIDG